MERQLFNAVLSGEIKVNKLTDWERAILISYATREIDSFTQDIHGMVQLNPGTTFEYWAEKHENYNDALYIKALLINPPRVITRDEYGLYYAYIGLNANRETCEKIGKQKGISGEKLYRSIKFFSHYENRTTGQYEVITIAKMIERLKRVIEGLRANGEYSSEAEDDLKELEKQSD